MWAYTLLMEFLKRRSPTIYTGFDKDQLADALATCIRHCQVLAPEQEELNRFQDCYFVEDREYPLYKTLRTDRLAKLAVRVFPDRMGTTFNTDSQLAMTELLAARTNTCRADVSVDVDREISQPDSLLLFKWSYSLFDGAGSAASLGYIDYEYFPPCDTWLIVLRGKTFSEDCLVSWVPPWARPLVQKAMWASPTECLSWGLLRGEGIVLLPSGNKGRTSANR